MFRRTKGKVFKTLDKPSGISNEDYCKVRLLTANQDFTISLKREDYVDLYNKNKKMFDLKKVYDNPAEFITKLGITNLSQSDKRAQFAKGISSFILSHNTEPINLIDKYKKDVAALKKDLINYQGSGYGNKKADMVIRDMVVSEIWKDVKKFDSIDIASDINTIKVALRTGILESKIPLLTSFLDIFGYQYSYVDDMNAKAWRKVWEYLIKDNKDIDLSSPCLLDSFIYGVIGKEYCKDIAVTYKCDKHNHTFVWYNGRCKQCKICEENKHKNSAHVIKKELPCENVKAGEEVSKNTNFYKSNVAVPNYDNCPFMSLCNETNRKNLETPNSISIKQKTGWMEGRAKKGCGGGGIRA